MEIKWPSYNRYSCRLPNGGTYLFESKEVAQKYFACDYCNDLTCKVGAFIERHPMAFTEAIK